jgi:hypothetical protein
VYIDGDIFVLPTCPNVDRMFEYTAPAAALEFNQNKTRGAIRQCGLVRAHRVALLGGEAGGNLFA